MAAVLLTKHGATSVAFTLLLVIPISMPVSAQQSRTPPEDRTIRDKAQQQDMSKREMQLRNFGIPPADKRDPKHAQALMAQVEEDFNRILSLHNEIVRATNADKPLDYDFVSNATAEIKKRASRLQTTLAFTKPADVEPGHDKLVKFDDAHFKDGLLSLCRQIESFIKNPVIEHPGTIDVEQSARAGRDLETVVELSGNLKKTADKLGKASK